MLTQLIIIKSGVEVKPGKPLKVAPEEDNLIHISQATLDCKGKMTESVLVTVTVDGTKLVIGTLSQEKFPQISFDLVFEKEFELSHNCTKGSVHFIGYRSPNIQDELDDYSGSEDEEEELAVPAPVTANGTGAAVSNVVKAVPKPKAKPEEDESDEDSDEEDVSDEDDDSEKGMDVDSDDSEEEEETPQKPEPSNKKMAPDSASKTPISAKKAKPAAAPAPPALNFKNALLKPRPCTLVKYQSSDSGPPPGAEPMSPLQRDDDSSSPTKNDFDKVTTFDLKGVTKTRGK